MKRRSVLVTGFGTVVTLSLAGCTSEATEDSCEEETVVDEYETYSAGESVTWRVDVEEDQELVVETLRTGDGARPKLEVEDPDGNVVAETGPSENIDRAVTARTDGTHYVRFVNEAMMTSGQWDITITRRSAGC